ncbi:hypothetical protein BDZ94DRAFT_1272464 [Collybia nuda]|uniref:F-box domain-containing protein n=1 Tax=Collybia nuda TaxID=64659 RepID=A0A9P5XU35_9AGAR|nr:hypothetical protein BDZ94DRAFT_1272464 [Collybia nuda]
MSSINNGDDHTTPTNQLSPLIAMVPIEVYHIIFQFVENHNLTTLSCVSRIFQYEAEHILYQSVDLTKGDCRSGIVSWCTAVTNVERRARRVQSLRFPPRYPPILGSSPPTLILGDSQIHKLVAQAFNKIINLKHLFFFGAGDYPVTLYPSTLKDCTFRLSSFVGQVSSFSSQDQIDFLSKHPDIEYWVPTQPFLLSVNSFPKAMLPRLRELVLTHPKLTSAFKGRPIEALVLFFIHARHTRDIGREAIIPMGSFKETLHTLVYIHGKLSNEWSTVDIINDLAERVPHLRSLSFTSLGNDDSVVSHNFFYVAPKYIPKVQISYLLTISRTSWTLFPDYTIWRLCYSTLIWKP